jgi:hypothetical protein
MFSQQNLQLDRGFSTSHTQGRFTTALHRYSDLTATIGDIKAGFPPFLGQGVTQEVVLVNDLIFITGSDGVVVSQILSLSPFTVGVDLFSGASGLSVGPTTVATDGNAAKINGNVLQMEVADATHSGIVTNLPQDFGGPKTFHDNLTVDEPPNGIIVQKAIGDFGVELITSDPNATPGFAIASTNLPGQIFAMIFKETGFFSANPELAVFAGLNALIVLDNINQTVTIAQTLIGDSIQERTPSNGINVNGVTVKANTITLADPNVFWDNGIITANNVIFNFDAQDSLYYDQVTNRAAFAIGNIDIASIAAAGLTLPATKMLATDAIVETTAANGTSINTGIKLLTTGGTPALLNHYEEFTYTSIFTNNLESTAALNFTVVRVGKAVTIKLIDVGSAAAQVAPVEAFSSNTALPAHLRPSFDTFGYWRVSSNAISKTGMIEVSSSGNVFIHNDSDGTTAFTAAVPIGFDRCAFSYDLE